MKKKDQGPVVTHCPTFNIKEPGSSPAMKVTLEAPTLSISSEFAKSMATKFIAIALDFDAPVPPMAVLSPMLHHIQADLVTDGEANVEGWVKLSSSAPPVASHCPPSPPKFDTSHRYAFLVWVQPEVLTTETIKTIIGLPDELRLLPRLRWDQAGCEQQKLSPRHFRGQLLRGRLGNLYSRSSIKSHT